MPDEERASAENELASLKLIEDRLRELENGVAAGADLTRTLTEAERQLVHASERSRAFAELASTVRALAAATGEAEMVVDRVEETVEILVHDLDARISRVERIERLRLDGLKHLRETREHRQRQRALENEIIVAQAQEREINERIGTFDERREELWNLRRGAETARNDIVRRVFNDALNSVWRDLFVRLAPEESFVPIFRVPDTKRNRLVAELATIYRDTSEEAGSPGTMLSAGNLNTAALTLFLALHLSVSPRLPWLLLDDPIQSMDEVHIQQFAALLRTLAKRLDRRIVIAVHERALFEYLSLELSAAQPDDVLITIELSRSRDGTTVVRPSRLGYVPDRAFTPKQGQPV
jgi:exonuclease SbcC